MYYNREEALNFQICYGGNYSLPTLLHNKGLLALTPTHRSGRKS
jgi:hypothetical protein